MKIIAFGEVLWDIFSDSREIGGAPFNFSAHAVKQGAQVDIVTAVGRDPLGAETTAQIQKQRVGTAYVNASGFPTGVCRVTLSDTGVPSYDLVMPAAYDDITLTPLQLEEISLAGYDCLYFGTLALRQPTSHAALKTLLALGCFSEVLCDVNLRQNYYSTPVLRFAFENATIVKISREELPQVCECLGYAPGQRYEALCAAWFEDFARLRTVIITLDKDGALAAERGKAAVYSQPPVNQVVSTVGAGDSFIAAYLVSRYQNYSLSDSINRAVKVSDYVVTQVGAIPDYQLKRLL